MLREALETLFTPCPRYARVMGYLHEVIAIGTRSRRCHDDWAPHLENTKQTIREAIALCPRRRKAVILGSGRLNDVPLDDLIAAFDQVLLVDMVHLLPVRWHKHEKVQLVQADITGVAEQVYQLGGGDGPLPLSQPTLFLDDPEVDLVASVNILSQLSYTPCQYLRRWNRQRSADLDRFATQLIQGHLDYLRQFRGVVCLIADEEYRTCDAAERLLKTEPALRGITLPPLGRTWLWRLVPHHENQGKTLYHLVRGIPRLT